MRHSHLLCGVVAVVLMFASCHSLAQNTTTNSTNTTATTTTTVVATSAYDVRTAPPAYMTFIHPLYLFLTGGTSTTITPSSSSSSSSTTTSSPSSSAVSSSIPSSPRILSKTILYPNGEMSADDMILYVRDYYESRVDSIPTAETSAGRFVVATSSFTRGEEEDGVSGDDVVGPIRFRFGIQTGLLSSKYSASVAFQGTSRAFQAASEQQVESTDLISNKPHVEKRGRTADDASPSPPSRHLFRSKDISENPNVCGDVIFNPLVEASDLYVSSLESSVPAFLDPFGVEQWISSVATSSVSTTTYTTTNTSSTSSSSPSVAGVILNRIRLSFPEDSSSARKRLLSTLQIDLSPFSGSDHKCFMPTVTTYLKLRIGVNNYQDASTSSSSSSSPQSTTVLRRKSTTSSSCVDSSGSGNASLVYTDDIPQWLADRYDAPFYASLNRIPASGNPRSSDADGYFKNPYTPSYSSVNNLIEFSGNANGFESGNPFGGQFNEITILIQGGVEDFTTLNSTIVTAVVAGLALVLMVLLDNGTFFEGFLLLFQLQTLVTICSSTCIARELAVQFRHMTWVVWPLNVFKFYSKLNPATLQFELFTQIAFAVGMVLVVCLLNLSCVSCLKRLASRKTRESVFASEGARFEDGLLEEEDAEHAAYEEELHAAERRNKRLRSQRNKLQERLQKVTSLLTKRRHAASDSIMGGSSSSIHGGGSSPLLLVPSSPDYGGDESPLSMGSGSGGGGMKRRGYSPSSPRQENANVSFRFDDDTPIRGGGGISGGGHNNSSSITKDEDMKDDDMKLLQEIDGLTHSIDHLELEEVGMESRRGDTHRRPLPTSSSPRSHAHRGPYATRQHLTHASPFRPREEDVVVDIPLQSPPARARFPAIIILVSLLLLQGCIFAVGRTLNVTVEHQHVAFDESVYNKLLLTDPPRSSSVSDGVRQTLPATTMWDSVLSMTGHDRSPSIAYTQIPRWVLIVLAVIGFVMAIIIMLCLLAVIFKIVSNCSYQRNPGMGAQFLLLGKDRGGGLSSSAVHAMTHMVLKASPYSSSGVMISSGGGLDDIVGSDTGLRNTPGDGRGGGGGGAGSGNGILQRLRNICGTSSSSSSGGGFFFIQRSGGWVSEESLAEFGVLYGGLDGASFWFVAPMVGLTSILNIITSQMPKTPSACSALSYLQLIVCAALFLITLVRRPFSTLLSNIFNILITLSMTLLCVALVVTTSCGRRGQQFAVTLMWFVLVMLVVKGVALVILFSYWRVLTFNAAQAVSTIYRRQQQDALLSNEINRFTAAPSMPIASSSPSSFTNVHTNTPSLSPQRALSSYAVGIGDGVPLNSIVSRGGGVGGGFGSSPRHNSAHTSQYLPNKPDIAHMVLNQYFSNTLRQLQRKLRHVELSSTRMASSNFVGLQSRRKVTDVKEARAKMKYDQTSHYATSSDITMLTMLRLLVLHNKTNNNNNNNIDPEQSGGGGGGIYDLENRSDSAASSTANTKLASKMSARAVLQRLIVLASSFHNQHFIMASARLAASSSSMTSTPVSPSPSSYFSVQLITSLMKSMLHSISTLNTTSSSSLADSISQLGIIQVDTKSPMGNIFTHYKEEMRMRYDRRRLAETGTSLHPQHSSNSLLTSTSTPLPAPSTVSSAAGLMKISKVCGFGSGGGSELTTTISGETPTSVHLQSPLGIALITTSNTTSSALSTAQPAVLLIADAGLCQVVVLRPNIKQRSPTDSIADIISAKAIASGGGKVMTTQRQSQTSGLPWYVKGSNTTTTPSNNNNYTAMPISVSSSQGGQLRRLLAGDAMVSLDCDEGYEYLVLYNYLRVLYAIMVMSGDSKHISTTLYQSRRGGQASQHHQLQITTGSTPGSHVNTISSVVREASQTVPSSSTTVTHKAFLLLARGEVQDCFQRHCVESGLLAGEVQLGVVSEVRIYDSISRPITQFVDTPSSSSPKPRRASSSSSSPSSPITVPLSQAELLAEYQLNPVYEAPIDTETVNLGGDDENSGVNSPTSSPLLSVSPMIVLPQLYSKRRHCVAMLERSGNILPTPSLSPTSSSPKLSEEDGTAKKSRGIWATSLGSASPTSVTSIAVSPHQGNTVFVATNSGIFSCDGNNDKVRSSSAAAFAMHNNNNYTTSQFASSTLRPYVVIVTGGLGIDEAFHPVGRKLIKAVVLAEVRYMERYVALRNRYVQYGDEEYNDGNSSNLPGLDDAAIRAAKMFSVAWTLMRRKLRAAQQTPKNWITSKWNASDDVFDRKVLKSYDRQEQAQKLLTASKSATPQATPSFELPSNTTGVRGVVRVKRIPTCLRGYMDHHDTAVSSLIDLRRAIASSVWGLEEGGTGHGVGGAPFDPMSTPDRPFRITDSIRTLINYQVKDCKYSTSNNTNNNSNSRTREATGNLVDFLISSNASAAAASSSSSSPKKKRATNQFPNTSSPPLPPTRVEVPLLQQATAVTILPPGFMNINNGGSGSGSPLENSPILLIADAKSRCIFATVLNFPQGVVSVERQAGSMIGRYEVTAVFSESTNNTTSTTTAAAGVDHNDGDDHYTMPSSSTPLPPKEITLLLKTSTVVVNEKEVVNVAAECDVRKIMAAPMAVLLGTYQPPIHEATSSSSSKKSPRRTTSPRANRSGGGGGGGGGAPSTPRMAASSTTTALKAIEIISDEEDDVGAGMYSHENCAVHEAQFHTPVAMCLSHTRKELFVCDHGSNVVWCVKMMMSSSTSQNSNNGTFASTSRRNMERVIGMTSTSSRSGGVDDDSHFNVVDGGHQPPMRAAIHTQLYSPCDVSYVESAHQLIILDMGGNDGGVATTDMDGWVDGGVASSHPNSANCGRILVVDRWYQNSPNGATRHSNSSSSPTMSATRVLLLSHVIGDGMCIPKQLSVLSYSEPQGGTTISASSPPQAQPPLLSCWTREGFSTTTSSSMSSKLQVEISDESSDDNNNSGIDNLDVDGNNSSANNNYGMRPPSATVFTDNTKNFFKYVSDKTSALTECSLSHRDPFSLNSLMGSSASTSGGGGTRSAASDSSLRQIVQENADQDALLHGLRPAATLSLALSDPANGVVLELQWSLSTDYAEFIQKEDHRRWGGGGGGLVDRDAGGGVDFRNNKSNVNSTVFAPAVMPISSPPQQQLRHRETNSLADASTNVSGGRTDTRWNVSQPQQQQHLHIDATNASISKNVTFGGADPSGDSDLELDVEGGQQAWGGKKANDGLSWFSDKRRSRLRKLAGDGEVYDSDRDAESGTELLSPTMSQSTVGNYEFGAEEDINHLSPLQRNNTTSTSYLPTWTPPSIKIATDNNNAHPTFNNNMSKNGGGSVGGGSDTQDLIAVRRAKIKATLARMKGSST